MSLNLCFNDGNFQLVKTIFGAGKLSDIFHNIHTGGCCLPQTQIHLCGNHAVGFSECKPRYAQHCM